MTRRAVAFPILLLAAVLLAYLPAIRGGYVWDDDYHVTNNDNLRSLDGLRRIWFQPGATPQYYPMTHTTFWVEYHLWDLNPLGYHLDNVLLHVANALLLWMLLRKLKIPGAWAAAAIFALHPVHVESVAWITERKNVLSALFYLLAMHAYLRFDQRRNWKTYALLLVLFACALLSKSVTASLPAVIVLLIYWQRGRITWRDIFPLLPMFVMGLIMSAQTRWMEKYVVGATGPLFDLSWTRRVAIAGRAIWFYAGKLFWPHPLIFSYPRWPVQSAIGWHWLFPISVLIVLLILTLSRKRLGRGPLVTALFFVGTLVPALGFIDVMPMLYSFVADHFQYLASIGLIVMTVAIATRLPQTIFKSLVTVVLIALGVLTWRQSQAYANAEALWIDTIQKNPSSWMAHNNLAMLYYHREDFADAEPLLRRSLKLNPRNAVAKANLATLLTLRGKYFLSVQKPEEALAAFNEAAELVPKEPAAHHGIGLIMAGAGNLPAAQREFELALASNPDFAEAHNNLGKVLASQSKFAEAIPHFRRALELNPNLTQARANLAAAEAAIAAQKH